jgi:hypothetical protein
MQISAIQSRKCASLHPWHTTTFVEHQGMQNLRWLQLLAIVRGIRPDACLPSKPLHCVVQHPSFSL